MASPRACGVRSPNERLLSLGYDIRVLPKMSVAERADASNSRPLPVPVAQGYFRSVEPTRLHCEPVEIVQNARVQDKESAGRISRFSFEGRSLPPASTWVWLRM